MGITGKHWGNGDHCEALGNTWEHWEKLGNAGKCTGTIFMVNFLRRHTYTIFTDFFKSQKIIQKSIK